MTTTSHTGFHVGMWERTHVPRTKGAFSGIVLVLLGIWGGIIPFVGPEFGYAYTPDTAWHYTVGRLWLEILPAAAVILGGLCLLGSANRMVAVFGGWLAAVAGAWFAIGPAVSMLWNGGVPAAGAPAGSSTLDVTVEQIGFFTGLGVVVVFLAALALGRMTVVGVRDLREPVRMPPAEPTMDERSAELGNRA
ncbi:MAG: hypothetical protein ACRDP1_09335 [Nocardioidaceae bacterium]